jgi:hypothetical protein
LMLNRYDLFACLNNLSAEVLKSFTVRSRRLTCFVSVPRFY